MTSSSTSNNNHTVSSSIMTIFGTSSLPKTLLLSALSFVLSAAAAVAFQRVTSPSRSGSNSSSRCVNASSNSPTVTIIDGTATAAAIKTELQHEIELLQREYNTVPGLAVILVGQRVDSATYVRMKKKTANEIGIHSVDVDLPEDVSEERVISEIEILNNDPSVHGILVQLPLPSHMDEATVLSKIKYEKDADGFDPLNIGNLWLRGGDPPLAIPCTPAGCLELLQRYDIDISGKDCVVLGRSNIVGMPVAALLQSCNGTVTVCHSRTENIPEIVKRADIVIAAIGKPEFVRGDWLKPGCVVIDVGINDKPDPTKKRGYRLVGDVNYEEAVSKASAITPVPGGVGPMTIAMLMKNTVNLCRHSLGLPRMPLRTRNNSDYINTTTTAAS
ncbi:methylenetetrahydrofolate dehydrogenase/methenyltetrahydrofolate cyclohydrolase [Nitzschia inconspicua]|uniref:Methylenetetrahydrofolate dehydrogenase/methenyltetrahydrofolate cyclohydrolase n=1 Tax=Nitzschia inconspicua TaxID=303405 RepID=A0A9K3M660_9STRA|nr:methylenetetrahydrofolate dehydrogenase/methenyltetrahydrofolate cyclohydrolase [Nitzschia inconspicua]